MLKKLSLTLAFTALAAVAFAQDKTVTVADFAGTWNIEVMSHEVTLVIEPGDDNTVTGTLNLMGSDTLLKGELVDRSITFSDTGTEDLGHGHADHQVPTPFTITLQSDGTISGEIMSMHGPMKWTGQRIKTR